MQTFERDCRNVKNFVIIACLILVVLEHCFYVAYVLSNSMIFIIIVVGNSLFLSYTKPI